MRAKADARDWLGLAVLALPCLLVSLDAEVLNMAAPQLAGDLRPTAVQLLWIMDSYVFVVAGALIAMGVLGDRIGRRRLLLWGAAAFAFSSLLAATARTPELLIAARVLMGLAGASLMPSTLALIRAMFADARQRGIALGVWAASFSLGGLAAPLIGGVLLEHFWWGSVFLLAVPATLLLIVLGPVLLPEARDGDAKGFDLGGAVMSLAGVLIFVYGIKRLAAEGAVAMPFLAIVAGGVLGALFLRRQRRIARPLLDLGMFRDARVRVALSANALSFFVLYGTQLAIVQYLQIVLGLSPLRAGLWALPSVVAFLTASLLGPVLVRWFPAGRVVAVGAVVLAAGHAVMALTPYGGGLAALVTGMVVGGLGLAPVYTLTTDLVVSSVRPERAGMAAAVTETGAELGGAVGIAVLGSVVVAAYRTGMSGVPGLPADGTLMDAAAAGAGVAERASHAYGNAFALVSLVAAALVAVAAVLAWRVLRPTVVAVDEAAPEPSDMVPCATGAARR
ncbi:MFS transporter [Actinoplanes sp. LDG1-06]|uniref:MFS transporter n=1 Tax=Paractinoplanes ovalisporus TaxID=2810368 RepID=A0ABS2ALX8_9ACTN|nr:MFS transporter [Actinoplanes ovalisporus]MBM2620226.1 MFS transporter [Actinoplanes ovalisporus]